MTLFIPEGYVNRLGSLENTEKAIKAVKDIFQKSLSSNLSLLRVTAPMIVMSGTGINDDLNGVETPVSFPVKGISGRKAEVVHSLAKWKRMKLAQMSLPAGKGIYTDMNALRPDEDLDNIHSIYVDQWDWELVIEPDQRTIFFLKDIVRKVYDAIRMAERQVWEMFPQLSPVLPDEVFFIHAEELLRMYPELDAKERENAIVKKHKAVFVIGIGSELSDGLPHDGRSSDYDDWSAPNDEGYNGLNGDLLLWNPVLGSAFEISSMGIRVDSVSLKRQLEMRGEQWKSALTYHKMLIEGKLPLTIGGGIGQSRLCMFLLKKAHIGEIQSSVWPEEMSELCKNAGIDLV